MAAGDFALPFGHDPNALSTLSFCLGRPFRQPLNLANSNDFSQGFEIWLNDTAADRKIFAMLNGQISYTAAANVGDPEIITFELDSTTQDRINDIHYLLEPIPKKVIYENVDQALTQATLNTFITNAYNAAIGAAPTWHPVMRNIRNNTSIKLFLDAENANNNLAAAIQTIVADFLLDPDIKLSVKAGDYIADAHAGLANDVAPQNCNLQNPRRVTLYTQDYNENKLNPIYYVWRFLKNVNHVTANQRKITFLTFTTLNGNTYDHPLLGANGMDIDLTVPKLPRISQQLATQPNIDLILFPVSKLGVFHGFEVNQNQQSPLQWRITNDANMDFEVQIRPNTPANLGGRPIGTCGIVAANKIDVCPTPTAIYTNKVQTIWNNWSNDIDEICFELQFPAEFIIASIAQESLNPPDERQMALERLVIRNAQNVITADYRPQCVAAGISQALINAYEALDPEYGLSVPPNPFTTQDANSPINAQESTLTWGEFLLFVNAIPERMSPGLIQTLVSTARSTLDRLATNYTNIAATFNVTAVPNTSSGLFFWLCTARHSILVSTAFHKFNFVNKKTALDLLKIGGAYNHGSVSARTNITDNDLPNNPSVVNPYLLYYNDIGYPRNISRYYNAVKNNVNINPRARLHESI